MEEAEGEDEYDKGFTRTAFPLAKWVTIVFNVGRLALILISQKNIKVCRMYFLYEQLFMVSSMLMPLDWSASEQAEWTK